MFGFCSVCDSTIWNVAADPVVAVDPVVVIAVIAVIAVVVVVVVVVAVVAPQDAMNNKRKVTSRDSASY